MSSLCDKTPSLVTLRVLVHQIQAIMSDLIFCFGLKGDFYFYSPERPLSSIIWTHGTKDFAEVTDVNHPLCVALAPSLDWFFGYQAIDGQMKWTRRREKGPDLKYGSLYKSCLFPSFFPVMHLAGSVTSPCKEPISNIRVCKANRI